MKVLPKDSARLECGCERTQVYQHGIAGHRIGCSLHLVNDEGNIVADVKSYPVDLRRRSDAPPIGDEAIALATFRESAKRLKAAETEYRAAQQAYAEAVKQLSEEATK